MAGKSHNSHLSPFEKLPIELLHHIFEHVANDGHEHGLCEGDCPAQPAALACALLCRKSSRPALTNLPAVLRIRTIGTLKALGQLLDRPRPGESKTTKRSGALSSRDILKKCRCFCLRLTGELFEADSMGLDQKMAADALVAVLCNTFRASCAVLQLPWRLVEFANDERSKILCQAIEGMGQQWTDLRHLLVAGMPLDAIQYLLSAPARSSLQSLKVDSVQALLWEEEIVETDIDEVEEGSEALRLRQICIEGPIATDRTMTWVAKTCPHIRHVEISHYFDDWGNALRPFVTLAPLAPVLRSLTLHGFIWSSQGLQEWMQQADELRVLQLAYTDYHESDEPHTLQMGNGLLTCMPPKLRALRLCGIDIHPFGLFWVARGHKHLRKVAWCGSYDGNTYANDNALQTVIQQVRAETGIEFVTRGACERWTSVEQWLND